MSKTSKAERHGAFTRANSHGLKAVNARFRCAIDVLTNHAHFVARNAKQQRKRELAIVVFQKRQSQSSCCQ